MFRHTPLTVGVTAFMLVSISGLALGGIQNSVHDLRGELGINEICIVCHVPHNAIDPVTSGLDYAPLWDHEVSAATYTLYSSATLDHTPGQPDGSSKLCLSCHDGSVAVDNYGGVTTGTFSVGDATFDGLPGETIGAKRDFGTGLDNDHPISFLYDPVATTDPEINPSTDPTPLGGTIAANMLVDGKVQCSSCHDVHDVDGNSHLLVIDNTGSQMCVTCHKK